MRKAMLVATFVTLGLILSAPSFAAEQNKEAAAPKHEIQKIVRGTITAIDAAASKITVQEDGSKQAVTVTTSETASLKDGMHVKIVLKAGTADQAESVKVMTHKKKK
ncbi:MAG: hypothetical protein HGA80_05220 [Candidatus Omnitrophica bacterium]|nr:hypothetical protein [Candidatus Omnitrophota bacterium]